MALPQNATVVSVPTAMRGVTPCSQRLRRRRSWLSADGTVDAFTFRKIGNRLMQTALLDIQDLTFAVGQQKILNGLGLVIQPQEIHVLLGANGSGKTALAYLLMGCEGYVSSAG